MTWPPGASGAVGQVIAPVSLVGRSSAECRVTVPTLRTTTEKVTVSPTSDRPSPLTSVTLECAVAARPLRCITGVDVLTGPDVTVAA